MSRAQSPPGVLRETAAYYEREAHALLARSEDLLMTSSEYFTKARQLRSEAEDREALDEARQHLGAKVRLVKEKAA